jgi:hypothetical protein
VLVVYRRLRKKEEFHLDKVGRRVILSRRLMHLQVPNMTRVYDGWGPE